MDQTPGFRVRVYRDASTGDCTLGGVSGKADRLTVIGTVDRRHMRQSYLIDPLPKDMKMHAPSEDAPPVALVVDHACGDLRVTLLPLNGSGNLVTGLVTDSDGWVMFGGNFAHTTDSRWSDLLRSFGATSAPVAVHDRIEAWK